MEQKTCCGGRLMTIAYVRCQKKGVLPAESGVCTSKCLDKIIKGS